MGQLAYFIEFLTLTGLWLRWLESCPLSYASPNAPSKADVLGTWMLSIQPIWIRRCAGTLRLSNARNLPDFAVAN